MSSEDGAARPGQGPAPLPSAPSAGKRIRKQCPTITRSPRSPGAPYPGTQGSARAPDHGQWHIRGLSAHGRARRSGRPREPSRENRKEQPERAGQKDTERKRERRGLEKKKESMHPWSSTRGSKPIPSAFPDPSPKHRERKGNRSGTARSCSPPRGALT